MEFLLLALLALICLRLRRPNKLALEFTAPSARFPFFSKTISFSLVIPKTGAHLLERGYSDGPIGLFASYEQYGFDGNGLLLKSFSVPAYGFREGHKNSYRGYSEGAVWFVCAENYKSFLWSPRNANGMGIVAHGHLRNGGTYLYDASVFCSPQTYELLRRLIAENAETTIEFCSARAKSSGGHGGEELGIMTDRIEIRGTAAASESIFYELFSRAYANSSDQEKENIHLVRMQSKIRSMVDTSSGLQ